MKGIITKAKKEMGKCENCKIKNPFICCFADG
jgi:hypothetical protein